MDVINLVSDFISHSPRFYDDTSLSRIDKKHVGIISRAYNEIDNFSLDNFRNWAAQNDLGAPAQLSIGRGFKAGLFRPLYRKLFCREYERFLLQALMDDLEIVRLIKAEQLLIENPVHLTPGVGDYYMVGGITVNFRWLRYIYLAKKIIELAALEAGGVWVDIGSYYGGLQGLVRKYNPKARIIMVDFHHQLCRSYIYLNKIFPDATHILPDQVAAYKSFEDMPEGSVAYVPALTFGAVSSYKVDLVTNFFSFGEMTRPLFEQYTNSEMIMRARKLYFVNRFVSAPFYEPTYDTDLNMHDYMLDSHKIDYFDIFPMHHYMGIRRELFGRVGVRNVSSPYFEMVSSLS